MSGLGACGEGDAGREACPSVWCPAPAHGAAECYSFGSSTV